MRRAPVLVDCHRSRPLRQISVLAASAGRHIICRRIPLDSTTLAALNCFLALGFLGIYLKLALLGGQWQAVARFLGKHRPEELSLLARLGFFYNDIAVNLLIVPLVGTLLAAALPRRHRIAAAFVTSVGLALLYFIELRAQQVVGQYISREVLRDLVGWAWANPWIGGGYVTGPSVLKLFALLGVLTAIPAVAGLGVRAERQRSARAAGVYRALLSVPAVAVLGSALLLSTVGYAARLPHAKLNASSVGRAFSALFIDSSATGSGRLTLGEALASTRRMTRTTISDSGAFVGAERGSDVFIFMMETSPSLALDLATEGATLPGTGTLYDRAFVAERHYTTHPYSSDAMYSVLSGLYPQGRRRMLRNAAPGSRLALMSALRPDVPVRRVYVPSLYRIELDDRMHTAFGADTLYAADEHRSDPMRAIADRRAVETIARLEQEGSRFDRRSREHLHGRLLADFQAMERMKADIVVTVQRNQRFCVMYFPQIGHAPWIALRAEESVLARGRTLMLLQDAWLKEIVEMLRRLGRLERTIIAVTADHGVRTRAEYSALPIGQISEYMFHVPLLVYAPRALQRTMKVSSPTSHIDFAPTLLALLGAVDTAERMQGVPIWWRNPANRIYFLGSAYGGADGFVEDGTYYMRQALSGAVYSSPSFAFSDDQQARPGDRVIPFVTEALADLDRLQQTLVSRSLDASR